MNTVAASTDRGVLETARYCMMDCLPKSKDIKDGCAELSEDQARQLMTSSGNGEDPASLGVPRPLELPRKIPARRPRLKDGAQEAIQAADVQSFQALAAAAVERANEPPIPGIQQNRPDRGALVADAAGKRAVAAGLSAQAGSANADSAASVINSTYSFKRALLDARSANEAKAKVLSAKVQVAIYARSAEESAKKAEAEIGEILAAPDVAAEEAAAEAEKEFRAEIAKWDSEKARADEAMILGTAPPPLTWAGEQIAKPYAAAAQRAQSARQMLEAQSQQLANLAEQLRRSASKVLAQAKTYEAGGNQAVADELLSKVEDLMRQAHDAQAAAERDAEQARMVQGSEKAYMVQAGVATERANVISRLYWIPPPVPSLAAGAPGPAPAFLERGSRPRRRPPTLHDVGDGARRLRHVSA